MARKRSKVASSGASPFTMSSDARPETLAEELRNEIVTGVWPQDANLPPERELMLRFGVSRPTYRESLRLLESQGLLKRTRGVKGGARILLPEPAPVTRYSGAFLQMHGATGADIWRTILLLEPVAAGMISEKRDPAVLAQLHEAIERQRLLLDDFIAFGAEERRFRQLILDNCGSVTLRLLGTILLDLSETHGENVREHATIAHDDTVYMAQSIRSKDRLIELLAGRDVPAVKGLWYDYLQSALKRTLRRAREAGVLQLYIAADAEP